MNVTYVVLYDIDPQNGIIAVMVFLLKMPLKSMNLVRASRKVIDEPVGKGVFGILPL